MLKNKNNESMSSEFSFLDTLTINDAFSNPIIMYVLLVVTFIYTALAYYLLYTYALKMSNFAFK